MRKNCRSCDYKYDCPHSTLIKKINRKIYG